MGKGACRERELTECGDGNERMLVREGKGYDGESTIGTKIE